MSWENPCRNFGQGLLSCALSFLQLCGEPALPNNGLQLTALNDLSTPGLPIPGYKHNISCTFSAPIVWSCLKTSYGAKGLKCPWWFPSPPPHPIWVYKTTQSVQFGKNLYNGGTLLFPALTPDAFAPRAGSGNQIFLSLLRRLIGLSREMFGVRERPEYCAEQRKVWGEREA